MCVAQEHEKKKSLLLPSSLARNHTDGFYVFVGRISLPSEYGFMAQVNLVVYTGHVTLFKPMGSMSFWKNTACALLGDTLHWESPSYEQV